MTLMRCPSCRYSFEPIGDQHPKKCPQCGAPLDDPSHETNASDELEHKPTQKMKVIPKPEP